MPQDCALYYSNGITGSNDKEDRQDSSIVIELNHKVYIPHDKSTGRFSGSRVHNPVILIKELDKATPSLYKACAEGERLDELVVNWYKTVDGKDVLYFKTKLRQVRVVSVEDICPNTKDPTQDSKQHLEKLELAYTQIEWEFVDGGFKYTDQSIKMA